MRNMYELKTLGEHKGFYSSIDKPCRRIECSGLEQNNKPFHATVKKQVKQNGFFKNEVFEIIQHPLN